jgi:hypothetical protein
MAFKGLSLLVTFFAFYNCTVMGELSIRPFFFLRSATYPELKISTAFVSGFAVLPAFFA